MLRRRLGPPRNRGRRGISTVRSGSTDGPATSRPRYAPAPIERAGKNGYAVGAPTELKLDGGGQLCKQVERLFEKHGLAFNKGSVAKRIRRDLSRMKNDSELPPETKTYAASLISALTKALPDTRTAG